MAIGRLEDHSRTRHVLFNPWPIDCPVDGVFEIDQPVLLKVHIHMFYILYELC